MRYLYERKQRIGFLSLMMIILAVWPILVGDSWSAQGKILYPATLLLPAVPAFFARRQIVSVLQNIRVSKWVTWTISFLLIGYITAILFSMGDLVLNCEIRVWMLIYVAFIPAFGAYLFSIKRPVLVLSMIAILLSEWIALGFLLSAYVCLAVLPPKYPMTLEELLTMKDISKMESDCLYVFTKTARRKDIIPGLEKYIACSESKFWGYHYLLHMSWRMESEQNYRHRVLEAEAALSGLSEIEILFPDQCFAY